jgi:hypothetical protein
MIDVGCVILTGQLRDNIDKTTIQIIINETGKVDAYIGLPITISSTYFKVSNIIPKRTLFFDVHSEESLYQFLQVQFELNKVEDIDAERAFYDLLDWSSIVNIQDGPWSKYPDMYKFETRISETCFAMSKFLITPVFLNWLMRQAAFTPGIKNPSAINTPSKMLDWLLPRVRASLRPKGSFGVTYDCHCAITYFYQLRWMSTMMVIWEDKISQFYVDDTEKRDACNSRWNVISHITYRSTESYEVTKDSFELFEQIKMIILLCLNIKEKNFDSLKDFQQWIFGIIGNFDIKVLA